MPQTDEDKKKISNPFGSGKNYLTPETNEVIGERVEKVVVPKGEIKIPIPEDEEISTPKEVLPKVQNSDTAGTNYLDPNEVAKLKVIPNPDLEGVTLSSPLATGLDENVIKKNSKVKKIKIGCIVIFVLFLIVFIFLSLVAFSVGRNNSLSSIAKSFPIESIPIVNLFIKPPELMVVDGLMFNDSSTNGTEIDLKSSTTGTETNEDLNVNIKNSKEKYKILVDDNKSASIELLVPSLTEQYFKISFKNLEDYKINPLFQFPGAQAMISLYSKYNEKYIKMSDEKRVPKVTDPDFFKPENLNYGISELQADNLRIDVANIQLDLKPKLNNFFENELTKLNTFVKVKNMGRVKVREFDTFKLNLDFTPSDLEKYKLQLRPSLTKLLVDSSEDISRLVCHGSNITNIQTFSVDKLDTCIESSAKSLKDTFIQDQSSFINSFGVKNISMYSDIETGRIVKYEFTIYNTSSGDSVNNMITLETFPLKEELQIQIPTESEKFKDFIKDVIYTLFSQLN